MKTLITMTISIQVFLGFFAGAGAQEIPPSQNDYVVEEKKVELYIPPPHLPKYDELGISIGILPVTYSYYDGRTQWLIQMIEFRRWGWILSLEGKLFFSLDRNWDQAKGGYSLTSWEGYGWWKLPFFWGSKVFWGLGGGLKHYIGYDQRWASLWWGMSRAWVITLKGSFVELLCGGELCRQSQPIRDYSLNLLLGWGVDFRLTDHLSLVAEERPVMQVYPHYELSTSTAIGVRWHF